MTRNTLKDRIERIELRRNPPPSRGMVVCVDDGDDIDAAVRRAGVWWPVAIMPRPCATVEEWESRYAPRRA